MADGPFRSKIRGPACVGYRGTLWSFDVGHTSLAMRAGLSLVILKAAWSTQIAVHGSYVGNVGESVRWSAPNCWRCYRAWAGDELVADAHFPGETFNGRVLRADGLGVPALLEAILPLWELDQYADDHLVMMSAVPGDQLDPAVEVAYLEPVQRFAPQAKPITRIDRFAFYDRARQAFAVLMTGETAKYGNLILKKGVIE